MTFRSCSVLFAVYLTPLFSLLYEIFSIILIKLNGLLISAIRQVSIWILDHFHNLGKHLGYSVCWRPVIFQFRDGAAANASTAEINIWMIDLGQEDNLRRSKGIIFWDLDLYIESMMLVN